MTHRGSLARVALSVLTVALTAMGSLIGTFSLLAPPAAAQSCDQSGSAIVGNWVITTPQVCSGVVFTVDGTITINPGGSLTLTNGGLKFTQDLTHIYSLTVTSGRTLILDNSIITTEPRSLDAYVQLDFNVNGGIFTMQNGAILKFPGTFDATAGSTISISDSLITGHLTSEVTDWVGAAAADDNDDAPTITWASSTVDIYNSRVERLFELGSAGAPEPRGVLTLSGTTTLTAINSYIGVDFNPDYPLHNEIDASGTSRAFLVGVTIDESQSGDPSSRVPPFVPTGGSSAVFDFYRWLNAFVTDDLGVPVSGTGVWSRMGAFQQTAFYPDNSNLLCPGAKILAYLGASKTCGNFNLTGSDGRVRIPLFTDQINTTTSPNAGSFGNFQETARVAPYTGTAGVTYDPYPIITAPSYSQNVTIGITGLNQAGTVIWSSPNLAITGTVVTLASSLEITGGATITDGGIYLGIQSDACNRAVIKVTGSGRLTLIHSTLSSNCPLTVYVGNTATLEASAGSSLNLDAAGRSGILRSDGGSFITIIDSTIDGDILVAGSSVSFRRDTLSGNNITVDTAGRSELWDLALVAVQSVRFLSDDGNVNTADFDIRNTTFDDVLTPQIQFAGSQWAQLTNVTVTQPQGADWWTGMITQNAKVTRYWWLRVDGVDGTGTLLDVAKADTQITISRLDSATLTWAVVPNPGLDDIYRAGDATWPVAAPGGYILYRASTEDRYASPSSQWMNATYRGEATATISSVIYYPDENLTASPQADTTVVLVFSALTPEMKIDGVLLHYQANQTSLLLPINRPLNVTAVVNNTGSISVRDAVVSFFSTNVDANNDGIMDAPKTTYISVDLWIGDYTVPLLPLRESRIAWVTWEPTGVSEGTRAVSAVVDAPISNPLEPGSFQELDEQNNILGTTVTLHVWPDLNIGSPDISPGIAIDDNPTPITVTVHNDGTNDANGATAVLYNETGVPNDVEAFFLGRGASTQVTLTWTPTTPGDKTISVGVYTRPLPEPPRNIDYNWQNNWASITVNVKTKPDIWLDPLDFTGAPTGVRGFPIDIPVIVKNNGDTDALGFSVSVFYEGVGLTNLLAHVDDVAVAAGGATTVTVPVTINAVGLHNLTIFADSHNTDGSLTSSVGSIVEGVESNNWANETINLQAPAGTITINLITSPPNGFAPGTTLNVEGFVRDQNDEAIPGLPITVELYNPQNALIATVDTTADGTGNWRTPLTIPLGTSDGTHTIRVISTAGTSIQAASQTIEVRNPTTFFNAIFLGLPVWLWLVIVIAAVVALVAVTLYFRVFGLGKMVECGECGSFIPEDSTSCPKCGVEFEKEMAKCSNCQAWIPVDVKQCPECGVEFATGKVEMADYQGKMRTQYDDVIAKFREEAQRSLGRALNEREFQEWWRKQPTFVTFEDWLREEEEMRKMGSKPCPSCATLNSVTATVCHRCGTYLKEDRRAPPGGAPPKEGEGGGEAAPGPGEAIPKKVIRKPGATTPVVQKKVIRRQEGEGDTQNPTEEEF